MSEGEIGRSSREENPEVLQAKYLDYCSAQIADLLLYLSPDEIYLLARRASAEGAVEPDTGYLAMVRGATRWLSSKVALPPFEVWLRDYRAHPDLYEEYLLGFWESEARVSTD